MPRTLSLVLFLLALALAQTPLDKLTQVAT